MLETDIRHICNSLAQKNVYSLRSVIVHFYQCQLLSETDQVFEAFFKLGHDAKWCRRQVWSQLRGTNQQHDDTTYILWPPLSQQPTTTTPPIRVINIRNLVFVPLAPRFMDQYTLRQCLDLYGV
jgi:hypothetical protein